MKAIFSVLIFILPLLISCNASLSDEQRKALKEELDQREIKKVNENEIFRKALQIGKSVISKLDTVGIDTLETEQEVLIKVVAPVDTLALNPTEKKIFMAYQYAPDPSVVEDNVQKQGLDTLIYSSVLLDNGDSLQHVVLVKMARKKVVLAL